MGTIDVFAALMRLQMFLLYIKMQQVKLISTRLNYYLSLKNARKVIIQFFRRLILWICMNILVSDAIKQNYLIINLELVFVSLAKVVFALAVWNCLNYHWMNIRIKVFLLYIMLKARRNKDVFAYVINISKKHTNLAIWVSNSFKIKMEHH